MSDTAPTYDNLFVQYASRFGLDWKMVKAICVVESSLGEAPSVRRGLASPSDIEASASYDGLSWGLMQVTIPTARDFDQTATAEKLNNPEYSVKIACQYLAFLKRTFSGYERANEYVVKSYNQGQGNTLKEISGKGGHFADGYYLKYMNAYSNIEGI